MTKSHLVKLAPALLILATSYSTSSVSQTQAVDSRTSAMSLHTQGNRILNADGNEVELQGVNIASLEWRNDGDHVEASVRHAIEDWKVNLIRLPLAQDRWFGKMTNQTDDGMAYRKIVDKVVDFCSANHVYLDLDLHWSDCGKWANEGGKLGQHNMPDAHSIDFWKDVATRYKNRPNLIFGLYNEPHDVSWALWRSGGTVTDKPSRRERDQTQITYEAVGMQQLYDAVRKVGAKNLTTISGLEWGYDLSGVPDGYALDGTNIIYETHPYPNKKDWDKCFGSVSKEYPVYVGEWGFRGTNGLAYAKRLMRYIHQRRIQAWTAWDFHPRAGPTLIKNWNYEPTVFGQFVKDLLAAKTTPN